MEFKDLDLKEVGNTIHLVGALWASGPDIYECFLPGAESPGGRNPHTLCMDHDEWTRFLRQTDLVEVEVLQQHPEDSKKMVKAVLRKCERNVSQHVAWSVYRRDHYRCRYCGDNQSPLTMDHLVLWELGGPSIPENLVACCRRCNKARGNMDYAVWLQSKAYRRNSQKLIGAVVQQNQDLLLTLDSLPRQRRRSHR